MEWLLIPLLILAVSGAVYAAVRLAGKAVLDDIDRRNKDKK